MIDNNIPTAIITVQGTAVVYDSSLWWADYLTITTEPDGVTVILDTDHNINLSVSSGHNVTAILKGDGNGNGKFGNACCGNGNAISHGGGQSVRPRRSPVEMVMPYLTATVMATLLPKFTGKLRQGNGNGNAISHGAGTQGSGDGDAVSYDGQTVRQGSGDGDAVSYGDGEALKSGRGVGRAIQLPQKPS